MRKYLFILSKYGDDIQTNGRVLQPIIEELQASGHDVTCLSESEAEREYEYHGTHVYTIRQRWFHSLLRKKNMLSRLGRFAERATMLTNYFRYPNIDNTTALRLFTKASELHEKYHYDCVIAINRKYANVQSLMYFKKRYQSVKCAVIYFDLLDANRPKYYSQRCFDYLCLKTQKEICRTIDRVFYPEIAKSTIENLFSEEESKEPLIKSSAAVRRIFSLIRSVPKAGNTYSIPPLLEPSAEEKSLAVSSCRFNQSFPNIAFFDYPGFGPIIRSSVVKETTGNQYTFVYAGTLNKTYRSPEPVFRVLSLIKSVDKKIVLKLFSKGDYKELLAKHSRDKGYCIEDNGMIPKLELDEYYAKADCVINISNRGLKAIPSKVFELIALGKPILNFVQEENDASLSYFSKYPMVCNVRCFQNLSDQVDKIDRFIKEARDLTDEEMRSVSDLFYKNTPEYFCRMINQWLEID